MPQTSQKWKLNYDLKMESFEPNENQIKITKIDTTFDNY